MKTDQNTNDELLSGQLEDRECAPFYHTYTKLSRGRNLFKRLDEGEAEMMALISSLDDEKALYRYASGKWTIKEIIGHIIDTERIMAYRALAFARGEKAEIPGYDHNEYVREANFNEVSIHNLVKNYMSVRKSTKALFSTFSQDMLLRSGTASNCRFTVRSLGFIIAGHEMHHQVIMKERYLREL